MNIQARSMLARKKMKIDLDGIGTANSYMEKYFMSSPGLRDISEGRAKIN